MKSEIFREAAALIIQGKEYCCDAIGYAMGYYPYQGSLEKEREWIKLCNILREYYDDKNIGVSGPLWSCTLDSKEDQEARIIALLLLAEIYENE